MGKVKTRQDLAWLAYKATLKFNHRCSVNLDLQDRTFIHPLSRHRAVVRPTATRALGSGGDLGAGFRVFLQYPHDPRSFVRSGGGRT